MSTLFTLGFVMSLSTGFANVSLKYNSIGFYQMAKIAVTPSIVFAEFVLYRKNVSLPKVLAWTVVSVGVVVATVTDLQFHLFGACVALAWIVPSAVNKILWSRLQQQENWTALSLMWETTPITLIFLVAMLPCLDPPGVLSFDWNLSNTLVIFGSAILGFLLQWSGALALGATSAISHVVLGQFKTCVLLLGNFYLFASNPHNQHRCNHPLILRNWRGKEARSESDTTEANSDRRQSPLHLAAIVSFRSIPSAKDEDFNYRFNSISFKGKEGWIVGKPAILLYTSDAGESWERIPLSAELPGDMVYIKATADKGAEMVTDEGAIYVTANRGYNWKAAVQESVSATLNITVSSGISGASYYTGTFNTVNRSPDGRYVAVSSRGNFYLTWEPGQAYWQPHNRAVARRIQNMGWRADGGLWLLVRGGGLYLSKGTGITEEFEEVPVQSRGFGILDVGYRSTDEAWAAGGSGVLLRTNNGGKSWIRDKAADNIAANLYAVKFIDDKKGFVLGNDGVLLRYLGYSFNSTWFVNSIAIL